MSDKLVDRRDIEFVLYEMLNTESLCERDRFKEHSREVFDLVLDTAEQVAMEVFWPHYQSMDAEGAQFDGKDVTVPQGMHEIWKTAKEGGWFGPAMDYDYGGQQMPYVIHSTISYLFNAANTSAYMFIGQVGGAVLLIDLFGTPEQKEQYLGKLMAGEWGGTMCLSEPDVGSSLGDITTTATLSPDGSHYLIKGVKRWISSGDHDLSDNIVHPVLAKIEGGPPGSKGISLFIVPKNRLNENGEAGEFNDVVTTGLEHKLGLRAQPTATLNLGDNDDCHGYLLGVENEGLREMLHLVNSARIHTGVQAIAQASAAYQIALKYCRERIQGREVTNMDPDLEPISIIRHADVRRMLLWQKAYIEGLFSLLGYCAAASDEERNSPDDEDRERAKELLGVLTPVCKAYGSDKSTECIRLAIQCLGGAGYTEDFALGQMLRDNKVFSIYEGTNGIQGLDLLGRRVVRNNGSAFRALMEEMGKTLADADGIEGIADIRDKFAASQDKLVAVMTHLAGVGMGGEVALYTANSSLFLRIFSEVCIAWQWLAQAAIAQRALDAGTEEATFYTSKVETARFYVNNTLPLMHASAQIILDNERGALDFEDAWFGGECVTAPANA
jgi:alkylation response protein AidB-like acyl-CoA dehydrogenase